MESKVYWTDLRTSAHENLPQKLARLIRTAGMETIDFNGKFAAIKLHFGEPGNLAFLRPNYAKAVADVVRACGGTPFLTDCNTLYVGRRKNAIDHLNAAYENGFSPFSTGCHVIIGDGLKGTDEVSVPVAGGQYVREAKIGRAIMDADVIISLNHFKPYVNGAVCVACGECRRNCAHDAITIDTAAHIDHAKCVGCGRCLGACPTNAVCPASDESNDILNCKIAEYTKAVIAGRPSFHISLVIDVSPNCDCRAENDTPFVPDIGMFASFDPVALDAACADAVNRAPMLAHGPAEGDHFDAVHPTTNWRVALEHAERLGIGQRAYTLCRV